MTEDHNPSWGPSSQGPEGSWGYSSEPSPEPSPTQSTRDPRKKRVAILVVVAIVLVAAAAAAYFILKPPAGPAIDSSASPYSIPGYDNPDGAETGQIRIPAYSEWDMDAGSDVIKVPLINTSGNPCYMKFTVTLTDTGEDIYESDLVPPGQAIPEIHLNHPLEAGTYPIIVTIGTADLEDPDQPLNGAQLGTKIVAK